MSPIKKILVIKPSALGDVIQTIPAVRVIKNLMPESEISWVVSGKFRKIVEMVDAVSEVYDFKRDKWGNILFLPVTLIEMISLIIKIRMKKFDICFDFQGLFRSGLITWLSGAKIKAGFADAREFAAMFYNRKCPIRRDSVNSVERYIGLVSEVSGKKEKQEVRYRLNVPHPILKLGEVMWFKPGTKGPKICFMPGSQWHSKRWDVENYRKTVFFLRDKVDARMIITGTREEEEIGNRIVYGCEKAMNLCGKTDILSLTGILSLSDLVITNDNGAMHLAAALGKKMICIFGPSSPERTGPEGKGIFIFRSKLPCAPCFKRKCPKGRCMTDISVSIVASRALEMLDMENRASK
ncbi:glycosyltransferase family 9 protein [bacterium]|jgi:heptosyltransferase-1|nr:glycosyltransferase family 9 protein [bacterium]